MGKILRRFIKIFLNEIKNNLEMKMHYLHLSLSHTHAHCCKNIIFYEKRKIYQRQDVKKLNLQLTLFRFAFHIKLIRLKKLAKKWQLLSLKTNQLIATCNLFVFEELIVLHFCESRLLPFRNVQLGFKS